MKKIMDNKVFQIGLTAFLVIATSILFYFILKNLGMIFGFVGKILSILTPLIIGLIMAYIMNPIVKVFENNVFVKVKKDSTKRTLSIACTVLIIFAILSALISIIIPQLLQSVQNLVVNVPTYINEIEELIKSWVKDSDIEKLVLNNYDTIAENITNLVNNKILPSTDLLLNKISSGVIGFISTVFNIAIGTVFAIYILANTKSFTAGVRKTLYSLFNVERVNKFVDEINHINDVFIHFIIGKVCDSSLVALITFLFLIIFKFPYPLLIAVIIGLTDLIPYFGPYIGSVPSALLILLVSPVKAITFVLFMIVLQQIDGNFITPKIQKQATGLPSFWVLFAITLFGGIFGVVGMLIGVPCFTIIYEIINDLINNRLKKKNMPIEINFYNDVEKVEERVIKSRLFNKKNN